MQVLEQCSLSSNKQGQRGNYYKTGNGQPIVLLHGFAETYEIWNNLLPDLATKYQLIIPHIPGCGTSENFSEAMSMARIAQFVNEILEQEQIEKTILFGHSMGGYAAMAFAKKYSNKLLGLSLVHSSAAGDDDEKKKVRQTAIDYILKNGKENFLKTLIPKLYGNTASFDQEKKEHLVMANQYSTEQIIACYNAMLKREDLTELLPQLNFPIEFIGGKEDSSINYKDLEQQAALCTQKNLHFFENVGHTSMIENPKKLLAAIIGFADDIFPTI